MTMWIVTQQNSLKGFAKSEQVYALNKSEAWDLKERESYLPLSRANVSNIYNFSANYLA